MNKIGFLSIVVVYCEVCLVLCDFSYPYVRRDDTISDDYFGIKVKDPYRWLENPDSKETKKFVSEENKVTRQYLDNNKYRARISQSFSQLYNYPKYSPPFKGGSKYYYFANTGLQNQNIYYSIDSIDSNNSKVFLDPNQLSSDGTTSLKFIKFSKDGKYCAYGISKGGSDWTTIIIKDSETLNDLPDTLTKIKFPSISWTHDNLGFFYTVYDEYNGTGTGREPEIPKNQKIFYHKINTNQRDDIKIASFPGQPFILIYSVEVSNDDKYVHIFTEEGSAGNVWSFAKIESLPIQNSLNLNVATKSSDSQYTYVSGEENTIYLLTNRNAPKFRLIRVDLDNHQESNWTEIIPEDKDNVLRSAQVFNEDKLITTYMRDVVNVIQIHNLIDGKFIRKVDTPIGDGYIIADRNDTEFFYFLTSYLHPGTIYRYDITTNKVDTFRESKVSGMNIDDFVTKQVFYPSKDGSVKVPMFLVHRKDIKLDGSNPTLLYAYGGFGLNSQPYYEPLATFFFKNLNGVFASANIRGGGEYGESWHRAGMRTNKQNCFDDFASAAEYLISNNYTQRERLTIWGASNGGLLVGASANQRPDLFGCALAQVGVMDMLRFPLFTVGYAWTQDFGDPQHNKTEFQYIYKYSPLHSIPENATQYPAMLVFTADHDDRVVPAHSLKFAAQLQYELGSKIGNTPLMIRIDTNSGHGLGKPVSKTIEENTDTVVFVMNSLNITFK